MMRFEHLIQINDVRIPLLDLLTAEQLWKGLILRANNPHHFIFGLENHVILDTQTDANGLFVLHRMLDFGTFQVLDRVELNAMTRQSVTYVLPEQQFPPSHMSIRVEAPASGGLFLRFVYEWEPDTTQGQIDETVEGLRQQAYKKADLDTVQTIRELARRSLLDDDQTLQ